MHGKSDLMIDIIDHLIERIKFITIISSPKSDYKIMIIIVRFRTCVNYYFIGNHFTRSFESVKIKSQRIKYNQRRKLPMKFAYDIPDSFWSLFRSMNRELYMEALLKLSLIHI